MYNIRVYKSQFLSLQELLHEDESFKYYKVPMEKGTLMTKSNVIAACKNANMQVPCPSPSKACCPPGRSPSECWGSGNLIDCVNTPLNECDDKNNNPYLPEGRCRQLRCGNGHYIWFVKIENCFQFISTLILRNLIFQGNSDSCSV